MYFKKKLRLILIIFLFIVGVLLSLFTYSEKFSILSFSYNRNNFINFQNKELLKGEKLEGKFDAKENNLGIVAVRFNTYGRINKDSVVFRIKQKNADSWYYQNKYKTDQFQPDDFFPFGLPVINNSKGKIYQFEIESISGKSGDAIAVSITEPIFLTKYQFSNGKYSIIYVLKKIINSFTNIDFISHSIIYFLPLSFFVLLSFLNLKFISKLYILLFLNFLVIILDILAIINAHDSGALIFLILGFLVIQFKYYKINSNVLFFIVLLFFLLSPFLLLLNNAIIAERLVKWAILFLLTALVIEVSNPNAFFARFKF